MDRWQRRPEHSGDRDWDDDAHEPPRYPPIAPGKRTLTMALAPRPQPREAAPMQRKKGPAASRAPSAAERLSAADLDWAAAVRPDLHPGPAEPPARPGAGEAMPAPVQAQMERAFGADFSAVRIHQDGEAAAVGALAFARGADIHFAPGSYDPHSRRGQEVLGHELAHTVQQSQGRVRATAQAKGVALNDDDALEREADAMGARAARGEYASEAAASAGGRATVRVGAPAAVVQRLIHVHDVNQLPPGAKAKTPKEQRAALRQNLRQRVLDELVALLGEEFADGEYTGESKTIAGLIPVILERVDADDGYKNLEALEGLRQEINDGLLAIEEAQARVEKRDLPRLGLGSVPIGNEFTFTNQSLHNVFDKHRTRIRDAKDDDARKKAKAAYDGENTKAVEALIQRWDQHMQSFAAARSDKADKAFGVVRTEGKDHKGRKVRYSFPGIEWHYDVTVDQGCVEVITPPVAASKLERGEIADAIDTYIFGVATAVGLAPDPEFGGGHINVDRVIGFERGGRNLASFLRAFVNDAAFWKKLDPDEVNAPFPDELGGPKKQKAMQDVLDKYEPQYKQKDADVAAINGRLAAELIRDVFDTNLAGERKSSSPHYQAVNLEHFAEPNEAEQRVEVRRVPAQTSRADLLDQLDRLFGLMGGVDVPAEPRFGGASSSSGKPSSGGGDKPHVLGANDLAPAQGPVLAAHNLVHVPILGDGNCFFNAVIRTAGLDVAMQALRDELADAVEAARDNDQLDDDFPFIPGDDVDQVIADLRRSGSYANLAGDVAPQILAAVRQYTLHIVQGDGTVQQVGNGATPVWLVRTTHSVDHYLATRPA